MPATSNINDLQRSGTESTDAATTFALVLFSALSLRSELQSNSDPEILIIIPLSTFLNSRWLLSTEWYLRIHCHLYIR